MTTPEGDVPAGDAAVDVIDDEADLAVVDEQAVARAGVGGEFGVGGGDPVMGSLAVRHGDAHGLAVGPHRLGLGEPAEPDLGSLQICENADGAAGGVGRRPHSPVGRFMIGVLAVAEVQSRHVHPGLDQGCDHLIRAGRRAEGADDLAAARHEA